MIGRALGLGGRRVVGRVFANMARRRMVESSQARKRVVYSWRSSMAESLFVCLFLDFEIKCLFLDVPIKNGKREAQKVPKFG